MVSHIGAPAQRTTLCPHHSGKQDSKPTATWHRGGLLPKRRGRTKTSAFDSLPVVTITSAKQAHELLSAACSWCPAIKERLGNVILLTSHSAIEVIGSY
ncbi:hypothetical protein NDU88_004091 [Pleurodeles waltl]|uniref:Uncharacterized protein n=1 Tax=Pleurodeles waltl TaxID=8319 RepID=A0AAV7UH42_PLEWA|nr:hypothetical protein NDU88_004091 [Pleurodeles waltl]